MFATKNNNLQYQQLSLIDGDKLKALNTEIDTPDRKSELLTSCEGTTKRNSRGSKCYVNNKLRRIFSSVDWCQVNHFVDGFV